MVDCTCVVFYNILIYEMQMVKQVILGKLKLSEAEVSRFMYAWMMKFFLTVGNIMGWTLTLSITLTHFSINALPIILLVNALFAIAGMFMYAVLIKYIKSKHLIIITSFLAIFCLINAAILRENKVLLLLFILIATGLFITQISILISSYIESLLTPSEAEKLVPRIDSSETIGGIIGGVLLVALGFASMSTKLLWLWAIFLAAFLFIFTFVKPQLPSHLLFIKKSNKFKKKSKINGLIVGFNEIRKTPFLKLLLYASIFNWILAQLIEFQFAKAVNDSIASSHSSLLEHEIALTYGLGSLQILFHFSALMMEFFAANRILQMLGTLGGFVLHAILTFLSGIAVLFSFSYFTAVLLRNNFEMSSIIHKTSYETAYYAFKYGTQKSIREIFEGLVMPIGVIIGTLILLAIEFFFIEEHYIYPINIILIFVIFGLLYVVFQLRERFFKMVKKNLHSLIPYEKYHAIEVLGQMGHNAAVSELQQLYWSTKDLRIKKKIIESLASKGSHDILAFLIKILEKDNIYFKKAAIEILYVILFKKVGFRALDKKLQAKLMVVLYKLAETEKYQIQYISLKILAYLDANFIDKLLSMETQNVNLGKLLQLHCHNDLNFNKYMMQVINKDELDVLCEIARDVKTREINHYLKNKSRSRDLKTRMMATYGLLNMHNFSFCADLINLLLYGNKVMFNEGLSYIRNLSSTGKEQIKLALAERNILNNIPLTEDGKRTIAKLQRIYKLTDE
jgi:hypothetical protein